MPVYFARPVAGGGPIKIGYSHAPASRLWELGYMQRERYEIFREVPGFFPAERWFHRHFEHRHIEREWFEFDVGMLTVLPPEELLAEGPPPPVRRALWGVTAAARAAVGRRQPKRAA